ncbi:MAG: RibD family protein [Bacillota bacterium]
MITELKDRPYVICHMQTSIDGRISGKFFFTPAAEAVYESDNDIRKGYRADAVMNGATTCGEIYSDGFLATRPGVCDASAESADNSATESAGVSGIPREDFAAEPYLNSYVVCVDTKGTLKWSGNSVTHRGMPPAHVIEVLTEDVDDGYLAYLRDLRISYIFAGETELDLPLALKKLKAIFGIERVLLTGGGQMNWTFLQAGCLDEINVVILPMIDGNTASAGLFDRPASGKDSNPGQTAFAPSSFRLAGVEKLPGDGLWLKYVPNK